MQATNWLQSWIRSIKFCIFLRVKNLSLSRCVCLAGWSFIGIFITEKSFLRATVIIIYTRFFLRALSLARSLLYIFTLRVT